MEQADTTTPKVDPVASAMGFDPTAAISALKEKQRKMERLTLWFAAVFVSAVIIAALVSEGDVFSKTLALLRSIESADANQSRNPAVSCADPRNKNTPFCIERAARTASDWQGITRFQGGKANNFTLHGR